MSALQNQNLKRHFQPISYIVLALFLIVSGCNQSSDSGTMTNQVIEGPSNVSSVSPSSGLPGDVVTVNGLDFIGKGANVEVRFDTTQAAIANLTENAIDVVVPLIPGGAAGSLVDVSVTIDGKTNTLSQAFTYDGISSLSDCHELTSVNSLTVSDGDNLAINGSKFPTNSDDLVISVGSKSATPTLISSSQIVVVVPNHDETCNELSGCPMDIVVANQINGCTASLSSATLYTITDSDGDNLSDWFEENVCGSNPLKFNSDDDELTDFEECVTYTNCDPLSEDSDGDNVLDHVETDVSETSCQIDDLDGDGSPDNLDCAPLDENRSPLIQNDPFDGKDVNCKIDFPKCNSDIDPPADIVGCGSYPLGIDIGTPSEPNAYCLKPEILPGPGKDPFIDATVRVSVKRHIESIAPVTTPDRIFAYEVADDDDVDCGPVVSVDTVGTFSAQEHPIFPLYQTNYLCNFQTNDLNAINLVSVKPSAPNDLTYLQYFAHIRLSQIDIVHNSGGGIALFEEFISTDTCVFGD